jgi:predicted metal-dependent HD superfamily phosphohydrolase
MTNLLSATPSVDNLGERFVQHLSALNSDINLTVCQVVWQDIAEHYNETPRAYHTLRHIQQLFGQFDRVKHRLDEPHMIALALYYHDVIYDPTRSDNEAKSAEYIVAKLGRYLSTEQCARIRALIMMTATHQLDDFESSNANNDAAYLLDMDLSILGATWPEYEHYAQAVRQEYAHINTAAYQLGRIAVLEDLLAHSSLYLTDDYHDRLEQQARLNIKREIKSLRLD